MRDAVIVEAMRTPVGKRNGALSGVQPADLSGTVLKALAEHSGIDPAVVDDVVWGCVTQVGEQPTTSHETPCSVPAVRTPCRASPSTGSAARRSRLALRRGGRDRGHYDVAVAGGVESMSRVPDGHTEGGAGPFGEGLGSGTTAGRPGHQRGAVAAVASVAHAARRVRGRLPRPAAAARRGRFAARSCRLGRRGTVTRGRGRPPGRHHARRSPSLSPVQSRTGSSTPATLPDLRRRRRAAGHHSDVARRTGPAADRRIHTAVLAGDDPVIMLTAPSRRPEGLAASRAGIGDIDAFEVNEAFASVRWPGSPRPALIQDAHRQLGGAIALGHPLGASGARLMTTLVHHLVRTGGRFGLQTMCEGGGMANATIVERLLPVFPR